MDEMTKYQVTFDREDDGRWIAEVEALGVLVYGATREDAYAKAKAASLFALSTLAEGGQSVEDAFRFEAA